MFPAGCGRAQQCSSTIRLLHHPCTEEFLLFSNVHDLYMLVYLGKVKQVRTQFSVNNCAKTEVIKRVSKLKQTL